jgi:hypothetical protein
MPCHLCLKNNQNKGTNLTGFGTQAFEGEGDAFHKEKLVKEQLKTEHGPQSQTLKAHIYPTKVKP